MTYNLPVSARIPLLSCLLLRSSNVHVTGAGSRTQVLEAIGSDPGAAWNLHVGLCDSFAYQLSDVTLLQPRESEPRSPLLGRGSDYPHNGRHGCFSVYCFKTANAFCCSRAQFISVIGELHVLLWSLFFALYSETINQSDRRYVFIPHLLLDWYHDSIPQCSYSLPSPFPCKQVLSSVQ